MSGRGYEQVPEPLFADTSISLAAKGVYPILRHEVFLAGGQPDQPIALDPMADLAKKCGCSLSAYKVYLGELARAGWVETIRESKRRPLLYIVRSSRSESNRLRESESDTREDRNPTNRARDPLQPSDKGKTTGTAQAVSTSRPKRSARLAHEVAELLSVAVDLCDDADENTLRILVRDVARLNPELTPTQARYILDELSEALEGPVGNKSGLLYIIATNVAAGISGP